ncbi:protein phosphatase 1 regulatory subunit 21-like [Limulus polyphemus]|uniref:Protein phosphatase 1 regulatory subunit 21 n=1 Tax=Limulus polyphemus TaxID=6850 RepID=A0ABM1BQI5_LIMPO|nr:protein phosphatase 1 regulatory subunit 21-like [Limulus polyphemus]XP_022255041.1 protein phosphatase 1 regulatory subunit 21-like [Limulus polyphemus]
MEENPTNDLQFGKYHKLAAEYSKLKAQATVLKKAVGEEQTKNLEVKEQLKAKEQAIRKLEQEIECLNFRNLQLTKRVAVLQKDLDVKVEKPKQKKPAFPGGAHTVLDAELQNRIEENERLHQQVYSAELEHKKQIEELSRYLQEARDELALKEHILNEVIRKQETTISKLTDERAKIEVKLRNFERNFQEMTMKEEIRENEIKILQAQLQGKKETTSNVNGYKTGFVDCKDPQMNLLNVPVSLQRHQKLLKTSLRALGNALPDVVVALGALGNHFTAWVNDVIRVNESSKPGHLVKLSKLLTENGGHLKKIEEEYNFWMEKAVSEDILFGMVGRNLSDLSDAYSGYVRYLEKLFPYVLLCFQNPPPSGSRDLARLAEIHTNLQHTLARLRGSFSRVERYLTLYTTGVPDDKGVLKTSPVVVLQLVKSLRGILMCFEDVKKHYSAKLLVQNQLPTISEETKSAGEFVLSLIVSTLAGLKKVSNSADHMVQLPSPDMSLFYRGGLYSMPLTHPGVVVKSAIQKMKQRGSSYLHFMSKVEQDDSIPFKLSLDMNKTLGTCLEEKSNLAQQLEALKKRSLILEEEKEQWMLECQLLQARAAKGNDKEKEQESTENKDSLTSYLKRRIGQLIVEIQKADSKAVAFNSECWALRQRLTLAEEAQHTMQEQLDNVDDLSEEMKQNMDAVIMKYEEQLETLSEHVSNLNEKLVLQEGELEAAGLRRPK